jgi:hypothetical protein
MIRTFKQTPRLTVNQTDGREDPQTGDVAEQDSNGQGTPPKKDAANTNGREDPQIKQ